MSQIEKVDHIDFEALSLLTIYLGLKMVDPERHFDLLMSIDLDKLNDPAKISLICFHVLEKSLERALLIFQDQTTNIRITMMVLTHINRLLCAHLTCFGKVEIFERVCSGRQPLVSFDDYKIDGANFRKYVYFMISFFAKFGDDLPADQVLCASDLIAKVE